MEWFFIYKIQINESIYIGSTKNINARTKEHKRNSCDDRCCNKLYMFIKNNGGWSDECISIIDTLFCDEITSRNKEQEYINKYACNLNSYKVAKACHTIETFSESNLLNNKISTIITMDFSDELKKRKPNMSANSIKTYNSLLRSIYKNVFGNINDVSMKHFEDHEKIMEFLDEKTFGTRKTYLAALVCIAPDVAEYKKQMMSDIKEYNDETSKSELTTKLENSASFAINASFFFCNSTNASSMAAVFCWSLVNGFISTTGSTILGIGFTYLRISVGTGLPIFIQYISRAYLLIFS